MYFIIVHYTLIKCSKMFKTSNIDEKLKTCTPEVIYDKSVANCLRCKIRINVYVYSIEKLLTIARFYFEPQSRKFTG